MATAALSKLEDYQLVNKDQDIRGWAVQDAAGQRVGQVTELMVDTDARRVAAVLLDSGRSVPVEEISLGDHVVLLERGGAAAPVPEGGRLAEVGDEVRLPIIEERLRVDRVAVERGAVRVRTHVEEQPVEEVVHLREEQVTVERRPADRPLAPADARGVGAAVEVTETAEVPVVSKQARVVEEVVVRKEVEERQETVRDTLRRTEVDVEPLAPLTPGEGGPSRR